MASDGPASTYFKSHFMPVSFFIGGGTNPVSVLSGFDVVTLATSFNMTTPMASLSISPSLPLSSGIILHDSQGLSPPPLNLLTNCVHFLSLITAPTQTIDPPPTTVDTTSLSHHHRSPH